jgi:hypothetical protein
MIFAACLPVMLANGPVRTGADGRIEDSLVSGRGFSPNIYVMRKIEKCLIEAQKSLEIKPGDIYEDCAYHPVLCVEVDYKNDEIWGISLIDGSQPRSCSVLHCGVRKLTVDEAWEIKRFGPSAPEVRQRVKNKWWPS